MRVTPHKIMQALRAAGLAAAVAALIALTGPFKYADLHLPFPDTVAHGLLFYGLSMAMIGALPRSRSTELARALLGIGIASELAQGLVGREMSLKDFAGDSAGVALAFAPLWLGQFRALVRTHPHATFAELRRLDRRRGGHRVAAPLDFARL